MTSNTTKAILTGFAMALALTACGVKGPPEPPPGYQRDGTPIPVEPGTTQPETEDDETPRFPPPEAI